MQIQLRLSAFKQSLLITTSALAIFLSYSVILNPFNRIYIQYGNYSLGNWIGFNGVHIYTLVCMLIPIIIGLLKNISWKRLIMIIPIEAALHEFIWLVFYTFKYPAQFSLISGFSPTYFAWMGISILAVWFGIVKFDKKSIALYSIFIMFNLIWLISFDYQNTLYIINSATGWIHPYAFGLIANGFEWGYNILFTIIFVGVYKWH